MAFLSFCIVFLKVCGIVVSFIKLIPFITQSLEYIKKTVFKYRSHQKKEAKKHVDPQNKAIYETNKLPTDRFREKYLGLKVKYLKLKLRVTEIELLKISNKPNNPEL